MTTTTATQQFARFALGLDVESVTSEVREAVSLHLLDALGCGLAAVATGTAPYAQQLGAGAGPGPASAIGVSVPVDPANAALVNGIAIHTLDFDDTHPASIAHVSAVVAPAALAAAQAHEAVAGTTAAIEYLGSLGDGSLDTAFDRIREHEDALARRFLDGLPDRVELYGVRGVEGRTPTFCMRVEGETPRQTAERLGTLGLYVWDGDYYALEPMRALGLADSGGAMRAGFLHYTSEAEVDRLLAALAA